MLAALTAEQVFLIAAAVVILAGLAWLLLSRRPEPQTPGREAEPTGAPLEGETAAEEGEPPPEQEPGEEPPPEGPQAES
jgi:hypothetical protein